MDRDNIYQMYSKDKVKDVPSENLKYLLKLFMEKASMNMGCEYNEKTFLGTVEIVKQYFTYIPICYVASAFIRGSLGDYEKGRLVPRTVKAWLNEISLEFNRNQATEKIQASLNDVSIAYDLHKSPVGSAIEKKIDWYRKGLLKIEDWDKIPLKDLAERIKNKLDSVPAIYGINYK